MLPVVRPMPLVRRPAAFDSLDWLYEMKLDGFRALAFVKRRHCDLVSRNGHPLRRWPSLAADVASALPEDTVLDGEVVCLDDQGRAQFTKLLFGRAAPCFVAFDVLRLQGRDVCSLPLLERKVLLADLLPVSGARVARVTPVPRHGRALFELACQNDVEGIVAKWNHGRYETNGTATSWIKVKNPTYTQAEGRHELFEQRRTARSRPERRELVLR